MFLFIYFFLWKNFRARCYLKIIGVARRVAQGARIPSIEMQPMTTIWQKFSLFLDFQFLLASLRTTVNSHNSNLQ